MSMRRRATWHELRISRITAVKFDWDPVKAAADLKIHDVSFEQACDVFKDAIALDELDDREDHGEDRYNRTGMVEGRLIVVTYTGRVGETDADEAIRIISARPAEPRERRRYHET